MSYDDKETNPELSCQYVCIFSFVSNAQQCNHLVQLSKGGRVVEMDVIQNFEENTALIIVGDVSKYSEVTQTVNLHDYNTVRTMIYVVSLWSKLQTNHT